MWLSTPRAAWLEVVLSKTRCREGATTRAMRRARGIRRRPGIAAAILASLLLVLPSSSSPSRQQAAVLETIFLTGAKVVSSIFACGTVVGGVAGGIAGWMAKPAPAPAPAPAAPAPAPASQMPVAVAGAVVQMLCYGMSQKTAQRESELKMQHEGELAEKKMQHESELEERRSADARAERWNKVMLAASGLTGVGAIIFMILKMIARHMIEPLAEARLRRVAVQERLLDMCQGREWRHAEQIRAHEQQHAGQIQVQQAMAANLAAIAFGLRMAGSSASASDVGLGSDSSFRLVYDAQDGAAFPRIASVGEPGLGHTVTNDGPGENSSSSN